MEKLIDFIISNDITLDELDEYLEKLRFVATLIPGGIKGNSHNPMELPDDSQEKPMYIVMQENSALIKKQRPKAMSGPAPYHVMKDVNKF